MRFKTLAGGCGYGVFGEEMLDAGFGFAGEFGAGFASGRTGKAGVNAANAAIAAEKDRSRIRAETNELRKLVRDFTDGTGQQDRIRNHKFLDEGFDSRLIFSRIAGSLKSQTDNFQSARVVVLVEIDEKGRFIAAIRAPRSANGDQNNFALELLVRA